MSNISRQQRERDKGLPGTGYVVPKAGGFAEHLALWLSPHSSSGHCVDFRPGCSRGQGDLPSTHVWV